LRRLYRGLDEQDGAVGHILALEKTFQTFEIYNISNESPFKKTDLQGLMTNPKQIIKQYYPEVEDIFKSKNWAFPDKIDRVYSIEKAKSQLNYSPSNNFDKFIEIRTI
jgi:nucleoside-diphosphate-sugar epimerase